MADISVDTFGKAINATSSSKTEWNVGDYKGLTAIYELDESNVKVEYRVILIGQIQYQIIYLAAKENYNEKVAGKFFNSFKLKK